MAWGSDVDATVNADERESTGVFLIVNHLCLFCRTRDRSMVLFAAGPPQEGLSYYKICALLMPILIHTVSLGKTTNEIGAGAKAKQKQASCIKMEHLGG